MAAATKAQKLIADNAVTVFSKSYCPYCSQTKKLLSSIGAKFHVVELDEVSDGSAIQEALAGKDFGGQRTVPNIFIKEEHIPGGNSGLQNLNSTGQLEDKLKSAGAL